MQLESLEGRVQFSVYYDPAIDVLNLNGTPAGDGFTVSRYFSTSGDEGIRVSEGGIVVYNKLLSVQPITHIGANLLGGNDIVTLAPDVTVPLYANGGDGYDTFTGGAGADSIVGGNQNDRIFGQDGNDTLNGQADDDVVDGGNGDDSIDGESGDDYLYGQAGVDHVNGGDDSDDHVYGGSGDDVLHGDDGNDTVDGQDGADSVFGDEGADLLNGGVNDDPENGGDADTLSGGDGMDTLDGDDGDDVLTGGNQRDVLNGDVGNDVLTGGADNDTLTGYDGDDTLDGDAGNDSLSGDRGSDNYRFSGSGSLGSDRVNEIGLVGEIDTLDFTNLGPALTIDISSTALQAVSTNLQLTLNSGTAIENVIGTAQSDTIIGNTNANDLDGMDGNDTVRGGAGNDVLRGRGGDDLLQGQNDDDSLYGYAGLDDLQGGNGVDGLAGGLDGQKDSLTGGGGADRVLDVFSKVLIVNDWEDKFTDKTNDDVRVAFKNGDAEAGLTFGGQSGTYDFAAGLWTDDEVEAIDVGLGILHRTTGNKAFMETPDGKRIDLIRMGAQTASNGGTFQASAWNSGGGEIRVAEMAFDGVKTPAQRIVHEIGHNWQDASFGWEAISGWTNAASSPGVNFVQAGDDGGQWWFDSTATGFVSTYAQTNPDEDFADSFSAYFMDKAGIDFVGDESAGTFQISDPSMIAKVTYFDNLVSSL